ncbi:zinc-binding dehydrogenase [Thalassotalea aquiviva]|uniref:zinc-binding dehydrogenase n=1 Tax=Thalassotalea aquiviva TaxID=3242415 RepID=UPI00352BC94F
MSSTTYVPTSLKGFALNLIEDMEADIEQRLNFTTKPLPVLKPGQVLVKMLASPVNPSDLVYLMGQYGLPSQHDKIAGFEGCGEVIDANAGIYGKWLLGKRVALSAEPGGDGLWSDYAITQANYCLPVRKDISDQQASTLIVNPCTSVCLVEKAIELGSPAIVLNAAASQVGKGVIRYAKMRGLKTIATVRSEKNKQVLEQLQADVVINTQYPDTEQQLSEACHRLNATVFLDAVADIDTAKTLSCMPKNSTAIVYGRLTETLSPFGGQYGVGDLIFRGQRIEGFWLATHMRNAKPWQILSLSRKVQKLFAQGVFKTDIYGVFNQAQFIEALSHYSKHKSDGKVILRFD